MEEVATGEVTDPDEVLIDYGDDEWEAMVLPVLRGVTVTGPPESTSEVFISRRIPCIGPSDMRGLRTWLGEAMAVKVGVIGCGSPVPSTTWTMTVPSAESWIPDKATYLAGGGLVIARPSRVISCCSTAPSLRRTWLT